MTRADTWFKGGNTRRAVYVSALLTTEKSGLTSTAGLCLLLPCSRAAFAPLSLGRLHDSCLGLLGLLLCDW
jgi:hypothetical protein